MNQLLNIYKPVGLTPLQLIQQLRLQKPEYKNATIGYAGRLDPMAEGVMLLMIGEETKKREKYLSLDKEYDFTVLFGVETDTYDFLGLLKETKINPTPDNVNLIVNSFANKMHGLNTQSYPPYSSKTIQGKPLFLWAKEGKLDEIEIPTHDIDIKELRLKTINEVVTPDLEQHIFDNIKLIEGDFRQKEITERWKGFFQENSEKTFMQATFHMRCSSGTYVRQLVHELGKELGCGAITVSIVRTKLGNYDVKKTLRLKS